MSWWPDWRERGLTVRRDGAILQVPLTDEKTYDVILGAVAELDLPLHSLDQRRHRVAELFAAQPAAVPPATTHQHAVIAARPSVEEANHVG